MQTHQGPGTDYVILEAQMDATAKIMDALAAQRRVATLLEQQARTTRQERRQERGR